METFMLSLRLDVEKYTSIIEYPKLTILTITWNLRFCYVTKWIYAEFNANSNYIFWSLLPLSNRFSSPLYSEDTENKTQIKKILSFSLHIFII